MQLKPIATALCTLALALSALPAGAARWGDENDASWLPMAQPVKDKMMKMAKQGNFCLNAVRWGDQNDLAWLTRMGPCMENDSAKLPNPAMLGMSGGKMMVRWGDENDASWLPMSSNDKAMIKKMAAGKKGMCMSTVRWGDENDPAWLVRMVDC
jgi:hypothetical protein